MSQSPHSSPSSPTPVAAISSPATQISLPCAPPTPPPDSDSPSSRISSSIADFPAISTTSSSPSHSTLTSFPSEGHPTFASVLSSPTAPSPYHLPTSVSSPAWFPPFDPTSPDSPLVPSSSSATLVDACTSPPASPPLKSTPALSSSSIPSPEIAVHETKHSALEEGEVPSQLAEAEVLMKDLGLKDSVSDSKELEHGQIAADSPVLPSQTCSTAPPAAPARQTIPLPPIDSEPPHLAPPRQREESARVQKTEPSVPAPTPADPEKTPNVYINGLPPNFPEDQLFALASPFGDVRSVRSFTRHVGDAETGYGFVLFETIASAEKCINTLRRYRNLHPTFSKQVHKIPGTMYSQPRPASDHASATTPSASSLAGWEQESAGDGSADSTFKAKMERLSDKSSTNLYIEGLPLSIDEATLAALVSPYSIRSSRFFQTKLSSPPRIIAFVRLETRSAAEEIIERLHGRMVRGWNDPGSRISVRFADTSEQRELRRAERLTREGDQASNQLSIAQATLLNLRGKELHARPPIGPSTHLDDFHADTYGHFTGDAYPAADFEVDYSRVPGARYVHPLPAQQQQQQQTAFTQFGVGAHQQLPAQQRMNPAMASLLDSLQASSAAFRARDPYAQDGIDYRALQQQQQLASLSNTHAFGNARPFVPHGLGITPVQTQTQAHGGYTATEEFILRARANSLPQKRRPVPLDLNHTQRHHEMDSVGANIGMGVRGYRAQASTLSFPYHQHQQQQQHLLAPMFETQDAMNMSEEEFHAASSIPHQLPGRTQQQHQHQHQQQFDNGERIMKQLNAHSLHTQQQQHTNNVRIPRNQSQHQHQQHLPSLRGPSQNHDFIRAQPPAAPQQQTHHYQHSLAGNSTAHARNMTTLRPAQANATNNLMNTNNSTSSLGNTTHGIYDRNAREMAQRGMSRHNGGGASAGYSGGSHMYSSQLDVDQASPPLVSPALTFSSRSSVAAFSPTTPFFGSFDEDETTFRASQMDSKGKKINSRTATR